MILQLSVSEKRVWEWKLIKKEKTQWCGVINFFSLLFIIVILTCGD